MKMICTEWTTCKHPCPAVAQATTKLLCSLSYCYVACCLIPSCHQLFLLSKVLLLLLPLLLLLLLTSHVLGCFPLRASRRCAASLTQLAM